MVFPTGRDSQRSEEPVVEGGMLRELVGLKMCGQTQKG